MDFDTGSAVSVISQQDFQGLLKKLKLQKTSVIIKICTMEILAPMGVFTVKVTVYTKPSY